MFGCFEEVKRGSETRSQRAHRRTEADVWAETVEEIGPAPALDTGVIWVSVGDRGSDVFSYLRRSQAHMLALLNAHLPRPSYRDSSR